MWRKIVVLTIEPLQVANWNEFLKRQIPWEIRRVSIIVLIIPLRAGLIQSHLNTNFQLILGIFTRCICNISYTKNLINFFSYLNWLNCCIVLRYSNFIISNAYAYLCYVSAYCRIAWSVLLYFEREREKERDNATQGS